MDYMDNMHMVLGLLATLFANSTTLVPDLMAAPCMDLVLFTGGGAVPAFFLSAFLFSQSSFSLCLLFHHLPSLVLFLFIIFFCSPCLLVISCCKKKSG